MTDRILVRVQTSAPRRYIGVGLLMALGLLLLWMALAQQPQAFGWRVFLLLLGAGVLALGTKMYKATGAVLELTEDGLRDSTGAVLAHLDEVLRIERGAFAFKPSSGFLLVLSTKKPRRWMPGLWWRIGRRVGVGGVTPKHQTKIMAEMIQAKLDERT